MEISKIEEFVKGGLLVKIKDDLKGLRIFNKADLVSSAYFHSRRFLLAVPGLTLRIEPEIKNYKPDFAIFVNNEFRAVVQLEFALSRGQTGYFPREKLEANMKMLFGIVQNYTKKGKGFLFGIYDSDEKWFYPTLQTEIVWIPINIREFEDYKTFRPKWEELKAKLY